MTKSIYFPNPASGNRSGDIVLYDNAFDEDHNLSEILAHELSHRIFDSLSSDDTESYRSAAGWINVSGDKNAPNYTLLRKKVVAPDSTDSIEEDFSNNVEFFLFNPSNLQDVSPSAYNWISKHFGANFKLGKGSP